MFWLWLDIKITVYKYALRMNYTSREQKTLGIYLLKE